MEGIVTFRKLTMKSRLSFGLHEGRTVEDIMSFNKKYIAYIYFKYANITFTDDVIEKLGLPDDMIIDKPGKNEELYGKYIQLQRYRFIEGAKTAKGKAIRMGLLSRNRKKRQIEQRRNESAMLADKRYLQAVNQGHYGSVFKNID